MTDQLVLKWNNHSNAFNKLLQKLLIEGTYSDATILCEGKFFPVHQFVLSTCSEYFEEIFKQCIGTNNRHPFIVVKDIKIDKLEALLNYMYKGEVSVPQVSLPELIKAAEAFKIRGLVVPDEEDEKSIQSEIPIQMPNKRLSTSSPKTSPKRMKSTMVQNEVIPKMESRLNNTNSAVQLNSLNMDQKNPVAANIVKPEPRSFGVPAFTENSVKEELNMPDPSYENKTSGIDPNTQILQSTSWAAQGSADNGGNLSSEMTSQDHQVRMDNFSSDRYARMPATPEVSCYVCSMCTYKTNRQDILETHIKTTHASQSVFACTICAYKTKHKHVLEIHMRNHSAGEVSCPECNFKASDTNNLTVHMRSHTGLSCHLCPFKTLHKAILKNHLVNMHNVTSNW